MKFNSWRQEVTHYLNCIALKFDEGDKYADKFMSAVLRKHICSLYGLKYDNGEYAADPWEEGDPINFSIKPETVGFILSTKPTYNEFYAKMPFSRFFLDINLPTKNVMGIMGIYFTLINTRFGTDVSFIMLHCNKEKATIITGGIDRNNLNNKNMIYFKKGLERYLEGEQQKIRDFIMGFFNFIHSKDVKLILREYSDFQHKKRILRGQNELKSYAEVKITGEVKRYIDIGRPEYLQIYNDLFKPGSRGILRRHKVRGHWRLLQSDKFTHKKGISVWIKDHQRGKGALIKQEYILEHKESENNVTV